YISTLGTIAAMASLLGLPLRLGKALAQARAVLRRVKPDVVVGMGGYITVPGGLAAVLAGVPIVLHEQNSVAGMSNKLLARFAKRVFSAFPNAIAGGKRPMHTIIPGLLRKDGEALGVFGVMGGQYQASGQAALLSGLFDRHLDVQMAVDAPRAFAHDGVLEIEPTWPDSLRAELEARGHTVTAAVEPLGGAQIILRDRASGFLLAGSDPRKDGCAMGF
ncbi:MAG: hypothetical protein E2577_00105, partial [Starkeya sp.]|nr:hypothetical protein [Starkeya sp.]